MRRKVRHGNQKSGNLNSNMLKKKRKVLSNSKSIRNACLQKSSSWIKTIRQSLRITKVRLRKLRPDLTDESKNISSS